jgi:hypothetical protein
MASTSLESARRVRLFNPATGNHSLLLGGRACRRIRIAAAGDLTLRLIDDAGSYTLTGLVVGEVLDVQAVLTLAAGSTVTAIEVFY